MDLTFFGLTRDIAPKYRSNLFSQIHEIVFHGQGGYDWETIYNMPIWLRKFTFHQMKEWYNKEKPDDLGSQTQKIKDGVIDLPDHFKGKLERKTPKY